MHSRQCISRTLYVLCVDLYELIAEDGRNAVHLDTVGPCPGSVAYLSRAASTTVSFRQLGNKLGGDYCIGFIAQANAGNTQPLVRFYDISSTTQIGSITMGDGALTYTIGANIATFTVSTADFQHFQLCNNGTHVTLFDDCGVGGEPQLFDHDGFSDTDLIYLLADPAGDNIYSVIFVTPVHSLV